MIRIRKDTLLYRLASVYGGDPEFNRLQRTTICTYTGQILIGAFMVCALIVIISMIGWIFMDLSIWAWFCIANGIWLEPHKPAVIAFAIMLFFVCVIAAGVFITSLENTRGKFCPMIEFTNPSDTEDTK